MANLTPEQLARLRQMAQQGGQAEFYDEASGQNLMPIYSTRYDPTSGDMVSEVTGYRGYDWAPGMYSDNYELNGKPYAEYSASGEQTGQGTWEGLRKNSAMDTLAPFAMAALPFALSMFPSLGAAASFGTNPVLSGASASGFAPGATGAMGGLSGLPGGAGMDVAGFEGLTAADVGVGGMVPGGTGGLGTMAPLSTIEGPMSSSLLADSLAPVGGAAGAAKWLGPAATLLGGLAGAQGQKTEETSSRKTDPRVDPYLFGANGQPGLLQMTYDKLVGQMKPGGLQGYDDMQRVGMGLLNAPVAGNGFGLFGRYR